jgi:hypothetical protein
MKLPALSSRIFAAIAAITLLGGCETTSLTNVFAGYAGQAKGYQGALQSGNAQAIQRQIGELESKCRSSDRILYLQERGRIRSLAGDNAGAIADYQIASDVFEQERMKAVISASNTFFSAASLASNDMAIPYSGHGFEKVMLHNMQAINYLVDRNHDFARIELNRADVEQTYSLQQHQAIAAEAEKRRREQSLDTSVSLAELQRRSSQDVFGEASVKSSFQNALTFFLRGALFEEDRLYDKALIEYKRALDIYPTNEVVAAAALRVAGILGDSREQAAIRRMSGKVEARDCPAGSGRVVVIFEDGFVRTRSTLRLPFKVDDAILELVLPYYDLTGYVRPAGMDVRIDSAATHTAQICCIDAMAVQSLKESYNGILVRQILRMVSKYHMQKEAEERGAGTFMQILNIATDRADDRNWLTLPGSVQVAELVVPAGSRTVALSCMGLSQNAVVDVEAGKTSFVIATRLGHRLVVRGAQVASAPGAPVQDNKGGNQTK